MVLLDIASVKVAVIMDPIMTPKASHNNDIILPVRECGTISPYLNNINTYNKINGLKILYCIHFIGSVRSE